jgi:tetratricopeptide (TPR) repeat protein
LTTDLLEVLATTPTSPERVQQEIMLYTSLARVLLAIRGYTSEVEEAYQHALRLSEAAGEIPQQFPVLRGLYNFYIYRSEFHKASDIGQRMLRLAETRDDDDIRVTGFYALGANSGFLDDLRLGVKHLEKAISYYDARRRHSLRFRAGNDPGVVSHTTSAFFMWALGQPDSALASVNRGLELARQLNHPLSITYALYHSGYLNLWLRKPEVVRERAQSVLQMAGKHQFQIWIALGTCLRGAAMTALGKGEEGLKLIQEGKALYQGLTTPPVFWPLLLQMEAGACLETGEVEAGLSLLETIMRAFPAETAGDSDQGGAWLASETLTLLADLLFAHSPPKLAEAEGYYKQSISISKSVKTRMPELRATLRLGRLYQQQGKGHLIFDQLSDVYGSFTEGFTWSDLLEAKALLEELSTNHGS